MGFYPRLPFVDLEAARAWVSPVMVWYNGEHVPRTHRRGTYVTGGHATPDEGHATPDEGHATLDEGHATPDQGHATPDQGHAAPDQGHAAPDQGHAAPDGGDATPPKAGAHFGPATLRQFLQEACGWAAHGRAGSGATASLRLAIEPLRTPRAHFRGCHAPSASGAIRAGQCGLRAERAGPRKDC